MSELKSILITGCSSGIGYDAAHALHHRGWQVFATCRKQADCDRLTAEGLTSFVLDYENETAIDAGFDRAMTLSNGRLDVLFNNGAYAIPGAVEDLPTDALRQIFEANFFGWHHLSRKAMAVMRAQGQGRILQNSSVLGFAALRFRGAYNATKFALEGLSDTLRLECHGSGISIVLIEPGPIATRIRENSVPHFERWIDWQNSVMADSYKNTLIPRLTSVKTKKDRFELNASAVTHCVIDACEATVPRIRYRVTTATKIMYALKRLLPSRMLDKILVNI